MINNVASNKQISNLIIIIIISNLHVFCNLNNVLILIKMQKEEIFLIKELKFYKLYDIFILCLCGSVGRATDS